MAQAIHTADGMPADVIMAGQGTLSVPDAAFMYGADFQRSGYDLKLVAEDGREFLIENYFGTDEPPTLVAPNHTTLDGGTVTLLAGPMFPAQYAQAGSAPRSDAIGKITKAEGTSTVQHASGETSELKAGDPVYQGDVIKAGDGAEVGITFVDGMVLILKDAGQLVLNEYVYSANSTSNSALLNVIEGTFSLVAGKIAPNGGVQIQTPIATMGIRGTSAIGVKVQALQGWLSTVADPPTLGGEVHPIGIYIGGQLVGTLTSALAKVSLGSGGLLVFSELSPQEILTMQELTQALHGFYGDTPQANEDPTGNQSSPSFNDDPTQIQQIDGGIGIGPPSELIPDTPEEGEGTLIFLPFFVPDGEGPSAGQIALPPLDEASVTIGEAGTSIIVVLPFSFGAAGQGTVAFDLTGPVTDTNGNVVSAMGVDLVWTFAVIGGIPTWTAVAGAEPVIVVQLSPDGAVMVLTLVKALDTLDANGAPLDSLSINLPFTVTAGGETANGLVIATFDDDEPVALDDDLQQIAEGAGMIDGNVINPDAADDPDLSGQDVPGADGVTLTHVDLGDGQGFREITSGEETFPGSGVYSFATAWGTYTFAANGAWTFTPANNLDNAQPLDASFQYRITDFDLDFSEAAQPIEVLDGQGPQVAGAIALELDEAGLDLAMDGDDLQAGNVTGTDPGSTAETDQGMGLTFTAGSDAITVAFADPEGDNWTDPAVTGLADGFSLSWALNGSGQLVGTLMNGDNAVGPVIYLELSGELAAGPGETAMPTLTATITGDFPHAPGDGSVVVSMIPIEATDTDGTVATGHASATVGDDTPIANDDVAKVAVNENATVNFALIIDRSGSMSSNPGVEGFTTRLALAKEALRQLLEAGNVNQVMVVAFSGTTSVLGWTDAASALAFINALTADGSTNYEAALNAVMNNWGDGPTEADQTLVYFLSDGAPNPQGEVDAELQQEWETFLGNSGVDESFAVGLGGDVPSEPLEPIAWQPDNPDSAPILVTNEGQLIATLTNTLADVSGNVLTDAGGADDFGADGPGGIVSLLVDGVEYVFDGENIGFNGEEGYAHIDGGTLEIKTKLGGTLVFHFDDDGEHAAGDWEYSPPDSLPELPYESFRYTIADSEGDLSTASLTIVFDPLSVGDVVHAPEGSDTVTSALGNVDVLVGDPDANTFVLNDASLNDYIADYMFSEGDQVDLTALLPGGIVGDISNYVRVVDMGDGAVDELMVDPAGTGNFTQTVATLDSSNDVRVIVDDTGPQTISDAIA